MAKKDSSKEKLKRNIPLPIILINSYSTAEKYDNYLKALNKEFPSTMRNFSKEKKIIQEKKKMLLLTMEKINNDVKEMKGAMLELDILYKKEQRFEAEKENEIQDLNALIKDCEQRNSTLKRYIDKYHSKRDDLHTLAEANKFTDVRSLVKHFLLVEYYNESLIQSEIQTMKERNKSLEENKTLQKHLWKHHYDIVLRDKRYQEITASYDGIKIEINKMYVQLNEDYNNQVEQHEHWELFRRWINEVQNKINLYKETPSSNKDSLKQLEEVQDFIIAARKIIKR